MGNYRRTPKKVSKSQNIILFFFFNRLKLENWQTLVIIVTLFFKFVTRTILLLPNLGARVSASIVAKKSD